MNKMNTRYGATVPLTVRFEDEFTPAPATASVFVGMVGATPVISHTGIDFVDGVADLTIPANLTEVPLGIYKYQINVVYDDGTVDKFPDASGYDVELPEFEVLEALDETEVV